MKNSKKKYSGNKVLNIFAIIFEVIFSLIVIVNTFQMLWCGIGGIGHLINDGGIDNYTKNYILCQDKSKGIRAKKFPQLKHTHGPL